MLEELKRLKHWVEKCPIEAAMKISELKSETAKLREENRKLKQKLEAKLVFVNNGWEEERWHLEERVIELEEKNRSLLATKTESKLRDNL